MSDTKLSDVLDLEEYAEMVLKGYIRERSHPEFPQIKIANYSESCAWEGIWNNSTLQCRGLIFNADTQEVLARPFHKFFNYGQEGAPVIDLDQKIEVTEKMDGSLGIIYPLPNGELAISTRGSMDSDQARWATKYFNDNGYSQLEWIEDEFTHLFEIIYPENRIVVDYKGQEGLVLIGAIQISSGADVSVETLKECFPNIPVVEIHPYKTLREVLEAPQEPNREGFVIRTMDCERIKIKFEEYVLLHKFMTRINPKHVWEVLAAGENPDVVFANAPDEFHTWLKTITEEFRKEFARIFLDVRSQFSKIVLNPNTNMSEPINRKEFALSTEGNPYRPMFFKMLDGKPIDEVIWKQLKPTGDALRSIREVSPDAD